VPPARHAPRGGTFVGTELNREATGPAIRAATSRNGQSCSLHRETSDNLDRDAYRRPRSGPPWADEGLVRDPPPAAAILQQRRRPGGSGPRADLCRARRDGVSEHSISPLAGDHPLGDGPTGGLWDADRPPRSRHRRAARAPPHECAADDHHDRSRPGPGRCLRDRSGRRVRDRPLLAGGATASGRAGPPGSACSVWGWRPSTSYRWPRQCW